MYRKRAVILFSVLLVFSAINIALHKFTDAENPGTNKYIKSVLNIYNVNEIQKFYTKDYSVTEIEARVQKERAEIDKKLFHGEKLRIPDVILIGVFKAGTGTMTRWLNDHPQIVQLRGTSGYFEKNFSYFQHMAQMPNTSDDQIIYKRCGECFNHQVARERILILDPERTVKLLIMIRDPIVRLISEYMQRVLLKDTPKSFEEYIFPSKGTMGTEIYHKCVQTSVYVSHFAKWLMLFPRKNIHLVDADIFTQTPWTELEKIEQFLQIDHFFSEDRFPPNPEKPNFRCFIKDYESEADCMNESKGRSHPNITLETIQKLKKYFKPYNEQFFTLAGQRFSWSVNYEE